MQTEYMVTRGGYITKDQQIIRTGKGTYLKSYDSVVAFIGKDGKEKVGFDFKYSWTTSRYVSDFLGKSIKEIERLIRERKIILEDLVIR